MKETFDETGYERQLQLCRIRIEKKKKKRLIEGERNRERGALHREMQRREWETKANRKLEILTFSLEKTRVS